MTNSKVILLIVIATTILCHSCIYGGPVRSLAAVVAARAAKIPRSIRAPFRNTEMMTARGFGKRSQQIVKFKDGKFFLQKIRINLRKFNQFNKILSLIKFALGFDSFYTLQTY